MSKQVATGRLGTRSGLAAVAMAAYAVTAPGENALYNTHCIVCHGAEARGIEGLGVSLVESPFVVEFLKVGRLPNDPASTTGIPCRGLRGCRMPICAQLRSTCRDSNFVRNLRDSPRCLSPFSATP